MKKNFITFILACLFSTAIYSQIPNNSFEDWTTTGNYMEPNSWSTLNPATSVAGIFTCTQGTPGNPGSIYLKLTSKNISGIGVVPGIAVCGTINLETYTADGGFPYSQRPTALTGKWQHMIYGSSQGFIDAQLTRWDAVNQTRIIVGTAHKDLSGMAMSWSSFNIPFTYSDTGNPDSCIIIMSASGSTPANNDYLYVDNLSFTLGSGVSENNEILMSVYPNPAKNQIIIECNYTDNNGTITIANLIGKTVLSEPFVSNKQTLNIEHLNNGIYFVTMKSNKGITTQKVVVNK